MAVGSYSACCTIECEAVPTQQMYRTLACSDYRSGLLTSRSHFRSHIISLLYLILAYPPQLRLPPSQLRHPPTHLRLHQTKHLFMYEWVHLPSK